MSAYPPVAVDNGMGFTSTSYHDRYPEIDPKNKSFPPLTNRSILISGASSGIGRSAALAAAAAGASTIFIAARSVSRLQTVSQEVAKAAEDAGHPVPVVHVLNLDVQSYAAVKESATAVAKALQGKPLDILINNAAYLEEGIPIADSDPEDYWRTWEVNYRGVYWMTRTFLPLILPAQGGGLRTIVNVGSIGGLLLRPGGSSYQGTKHALMRFSEFVMAEYADKGVLCYTVHPGSVLTELGSKLPVSFHKMLNDSPDLGGDTLIYLSRIRRDWLAGRYISSSWDMAELMSRKDEIVRGDKLKMRLVM